MLKKYIINGKEWQFEEGKQPEGAVEATNTRKPVAPVQKAVEEVENKAITAPKNKAVKGNRK
ncbi:MAG: hypothetical protein K5870_07185 [Lachnospiraceae bacterium]|nr:hypothetical protein [Lachnospiraceae bacterium]